MSEDRPAILPAILMVAPNGARKTRDDHPRVPLTPGQLAAEAMACVAAGASMMHLHVRDDDLAHSLDPARYRAALDAIRAEVGDAMILQITTEAVGRYTPAEQIEVVRIVEPDSASVAIRELAPDADHEAQARDFFHWMAARGVIVQYILYSAEDVVRFHDLCARGIVPQAHPFVLFVLGRHSAGQRSEPADLLPMLTAHAAAGAPGHWSMSAFGSLETACALTAISLGGHSRIGFENNTREPNGREAFDNATRIRTVAEGVGLMGRPLADAAEARRLLTQ